jgi:hypothetical protein
VELHSRLRRIHLQVESGSVNGFLLIVREPSKAVRECIGDAKFYELTAGYVRKLLCNPLRLIHPKMFQLVVRRFGCVKPPNDVSVLRVRFAVGIERQFFPKDGCSGPTPRPMAGLGA